MGERPTTLIDYGALPGASSPLHRDHVRGEAKARPFLGASWNIEDVLAAAERTAAVGGREAVAALLARQQEARGAHAATAAARRLAEPGATAVVTGQQAVLFGGPLLVLWKAMTASLLARALEARRGRPVVPVFWVASDDHDFAEIRTVSLADPSGEWRTIRYTPASEPDGLPASRILLSAAIDPAIDELRAALGNLPHAEAVVERLRGCYAPGRSLSDAFARWLSALFPDLVVLDPADAELKALCVPILERELLEHSPTTRLALELAPALAAAGYHEQVSLREGFFNLFACIDGPRRALHRDGEDVEFRGTTIRMTIAEAVKRLHAEPALWSPSAILRPLVQDHLLPTAAYIGGPAEIAYHAQLGPSYAHFGVPRPVVFPRQSLTLLDPAQVRALEAEDMTLLDFAGDIEALLGRMIQDAHPEIEQAFVASREAIEREMRRLEAALGAADPTLAGAAESARGRALFQVEQLEEKSRRALKKREQVRTERLRRTATALFPSGAPQERQIAFAAVLARHGDGLIAQVEGSVDLFARGHQVVRL